MGVGIKIIFRIWLVFILLFNTYFLFAQQSAVMLYGNSEKVSSVNSKFDEGNLVLHPTSGSLFFSRSNSTMVGNKNGADIWRQQADTAFLLRTEGSNIQLPIGIVNRGESLVYSEVYFEIGRYKTVLMMAEISGQQLKNARPLEVKYFNNKSSYFAGNISVDSQHLLMSMEGNSTMGVEDLYVSHLRPDGLWSPPMNLGYGINTSAQEYSPFLAADNKTLFFASNGRDGLGSFDLFYTLRLDDTWQKWSEPVNLGPSVNTLGADLSFSFLPEGTYSYYVSSTNSDGYGDVRRIKITADLENLSDSVVISTVMPVLQKQKVIVLIDAETNAVQQGSVTLNTDSSSISVSSPYSWSSETFGDLELSVNMEGYMAELKLITQSDLLSSDTIKIAIRPLKVGNTLQLDNVLFVKGTANMIEGSNGSLDLLVSALKNAPNLKIALKGHTDNQGNAALNLALSNERVQKVREYLVLAGIEEVRLSGKGYGGRQPIASNSSESTRKLNRRVEFVVISN
ncbi:MAG: OmpA family protein [Flammeovirgaceae bacterium]|jgi:OmpA-OmpF porin, OOP family|nr:OmpA family protein [Flammeovirgaceae bacterium]|tara:strand:- start:20205 stop:21737 length:1533 start_codon:yes stop_codon:yes gene_type:complete